MDKNEAQAAEQNSAGNFRLRRILPDCALFLIPLQLLPFLLRHSFSAEKADEYRAMSPVPVQNLTVSGMIPAVIPLPDYLSGDIRVPDPRLYDDRSRFYPGRPEPLTALNLEPSIFLPVRISVCVKDRILKNCRKFLKYSHHVRAGPFYCSVFWKCNHSQV